MKVHPLIERIERHETLRRTGRVTAVHGVVINANGPTAPIGTICTIQARQSGHDTAFDAEIVRIDRDSVTLMPLTDSVPTYLGAEVRATQIGSHAPVGDGFLGRAIDAFGEPIDGGGPVRRDDLAPLDATVPAPLERRSPKAPFETGLRVLDGLLTLAQGQRIGIFAPSGAGKTTLMAQIARQARADVTILCLVGERGREVEAIWREVTRTGRLETTTLVAATADQSATMRLRAGRYALALAEHWRAKGLQVLLILDSATRLAMAMREIGLASGEPPTIRAYTPGVFAAMPKIVERCGATANGGSITAIMTVLSESEEIDDPICELMKSVLDGHILLSRKLAETGHFPAVDVPRSISRQSDDLMTDEQLAAARQVRDWLSQYEGARTLIETGLYAAGGSPELDRAIAQRPAIASFLRQNVTEAAGMATTRATLCRLASLGS